MTRAPIFSFASLILTSLLMTGCAGGSSGGNSGSTAASTPNGSSFSIAGTVAGLGAGQQVVLLNSAGDAQTVSSNSKFSFDKTVAANGTYAVTVGTQPTSQTCTVANGTGSGVVADIDNVVVNCSDKTYTVSGNVTGLSAGQIVLQNNSADAQTVSTSGAFSFDVPVVSNGGYAVTVASQPVGQICTVNNGTGSSVTANVTGITVLCSTASYTISGTVSGLLSGEQVTLSNNAGNPVTVSSNSGFSFSTPVAYGGNYAVSVGTEPLLQNCVVTNGSGNAVSSTISNISVSCSASTQSVLHAFTNSDGAAQQAGLMAASDGLFYGTTEMGGANSFGTIFSYNPTTATLTLLHSFASAEGIYPLGVLAQGTDGKLYGTTNQGGTNGSGTIFSYDPATSTFSVRYQFYSANTSSSVAGLVQATDGNFYGTTNQGGTYGEGVFFAFNPTSSALTVLHVFSGTGTDGAHPGSALIQATDGNLYGTTSLAGATSGGTIFEYQIGTATYSTLHSFSNADGTYTVNALTQGADGNLYGTTNAGGDNNFGTVFKLTPGSNVFTVMHSFAVTDGWQPSSPLLLGTDGNLYGTAALGGPMGAGTTFMLNPTTGSFAVTEIFSPLSVAHPGGGLLQGADGYFYATTANSIAYPFGAIFRF